MNKQLITGLVTGAVAVTAIGAVAGYRMMDQSGYAKVVAVKAATMTVSAPREECRDELVTLMRPTIDPGQIPGTGAGAVAGGILSNQVGSGDGKKIQEGLQTRNNYQESVRNCTTVRDNREEPAGYAVTYRLDGRDQEVRMDYDPGRRIPVEDGQLVVRK